MALIYSFYTQICENKCLMLTYKLYFSIFCVLLARYIFRILNLEMFFNIIIKMSSECWCIHACSSCSVLQIKRHFKSSKNLLFLFFLIVVVLKPNLAVSLCSQITGLYFLMSPVCLLSWSFPFSADLNNNIRSGVILSLCVWMFWMDPALSSFQVLFF